eukprot:TRINITY_DN75684_c0_g1_i1.p2 TRINITY_DN75684_c0_g1~~TRINITY_DN75684_c0_g1_i1.p2  ORF type:complete len:102 (+),score=8.97 TRINITY_DN75684_c0_g1_i1:96-401(+)
MFDHASREAFSRTSLRFGCREGRSFTLFTPPPPLKEVLTGVMLQACCFCINTPCGYQHHDYRHTHTLAALPRPLITVLQSLRLLASVILSSASEEEVRGCG